MMTCFYTINRVTGINYYHQHFFSTTRFYFINFVIRGGNGWEQTTTYECVSRRRRGTLCPLEAIISREIFYLRDGKVTFLCHCGKGRSLFGVTAGRDGNCSMSRRDGKVIFNGRYFSGGTGRYVTTVREFVGGTGRGERAGPF